MRRPTTGKQAGAKTPAKPRCPVLRLALAKYRDGLNQTALAQVEEDGQTLLLRKLGSYVIFREQSSRDLASALFLPNPLSHGVENDEIEAFDETESSESASFVDWEKREEDELIAWFRSERQVGTAGKCVLFAPDFALGKGGIYLFFRPDGTGFIQDEHYHDGIILTFIWNPAEMPDGKTLESCHTSDMKAICHAVFEEQINPRLDNPFVPPEAFVNRPLEWVSGSESRLRFLTRIICHSDPTLFQEHSEITATYESDWDEWRVFSLIGSGQPFAARVYRLCRLAFAQNEFRGQYWKHVTSACRHSHYSRQRFKIEVSLIPPSAHERIEALLELTEWLDGEPAGKFAPEERDFLLGLTTDKKSEA